jgi:hypothetical protein
MSMVDATLRAIGLDVLAARTVNGGEEKMERFQYTQNGETP